MILRELSKLIRAKVDDSRYFLSGTNSDILKTENGKEAVEIFHSNSNIDLILMDVKMPVMDGYTAVKLIRETNTTVPIIAQTAYVDDKKMEIESGCSDNKNKAIERWCKAVKEQTGKEWKYLLVRQFYYNTIRRSLKSFKNLEDSLKENESLL
jgi:CheY-like chemotaxis protein